tara:strand:+ start:79721 stop:80095 length:375 start_codon:yes stop_codon:yes gene_type:complete
MASTTCDVFNHHDARACIEKAAYAVNGEGELPHSVGASRFRKSKKAFEKITGIVPSKTYVGVVEVHYDEDELMYYQVARGKSVTPELVYSVGLPDLLYEMDVEDSEELDEDFFALYLDIEEFHL